MVIDMHVSPAFIEELNSSEEQLQYCRNQTGLYKTDTASISYMKTMCRVSKSKGFVCFPLI